MLCGLCPWSVRGTEAPPGGLNILFIVADDLRPDLGCYGSALALTPHLDALAARGVLFARAYCQQAVCNPSRASALNGLRPDTLQVLDLQARFRETAPHAVPLPQLFKDHGYFTQGIGKIFHNETRVPAGRIPISDPRSWSVPPVYANGAHWQDWVVPGGGGPEQKQQAWQCLDVPDEAYFDGQIADAAIAALKERAHSGDPFFLAVGFWKPHLPFNAPKRYWDLYDREAFRSFTPVEFPEGAPEIARHDWRELRTYKGIPKEGPLPEETVLALRHGYFASISFLDAQIGRVLEQLDTLGLAENTLVAFWSDHGFHLGEKALWAKTTNFELDARVPLILALPNRFKGVRTEAIVELIDLFPTLVDFAGLPAPAHLEGKSLRPQMENPSLPARPYALTQHPQPFYTANWTHMGYALRSADYRYIEWRERHSGALLERELYDHRTDPAESVNRVSDPAYAEALRRMEALAREAYRYPP